MKDTHGINTARTVEVWMDDYKRLFYMNRPDLLQVSVQTTEKIKVQRLQPSMPSVSQGGGCGITLLRNCASQPHKTFPKRMELSRQQRSFRKGFVRLIGVNSGT